MSSVRRRPTTAVHQPDPTHGVRIERLPNRPLYVADGRVALPLWVLNNARHVGDGALVMSRAEAAELHAELGRALSHSDTPRT